MQGKNEEIKEYFNILCNSNYPSFINKYLDTIELKRLDKIGLFCGCDYTKLYSCKYWYSRLDHSIACALMAWNFTQSKVQTLTALFHDLGTPAFSHCIDYLFKDYTKQESAEREIRDVLFESSDIMQLLEEDNIDIDDVADIALYSVLENERPKICVDRLEGIFSTGLVWCKFWELDDIKKTYNNLKVLLNEEDKQEIGFINLEIAEFFYEGAFKYSIIFQKNEDKFTMQFIADNLKILIDEKVISHRDLYEISEKEIIDYIITNKTLKENWKKFTELNSLYRSEEKPEGNYFISFSTKKRYVIPLVKVKNKNVRLNEVSTKSRELLEEYRNFKDEVYAFSDIIF